MKKYLYRLGYYPALIYWFARRPHTEGAGVIISDSDSILLVRHTYGHRNLWAIPGGRIKNKEKAETAAAREILEELGLSLGLKRLGNIQTIEDYRQITDTYFVAKMDDQEISKDNSEIHEYKWFPKSKIPKELNASTIEGLKLYFK